jgi:pSer/pThr/pTyr-binding forkhead associated (FHA) protein
MFGELQPVGGGDSIPLMKRTLLVGRRESCDIVLRFANVSAHHCQLTINAGYWYVKDMKSRNGVKVNGTRIAEKLLDPGDELSIAKHTYIINYSPMELGALGPPPVENLPNDILSKSLLERAGLSQKSLPREPPKPSRAPDDRKRYDVLGDGIRQLKDPNRPV